MQKIFQNCYELDKKCYDTYGLNEDLLMENAAQSLARVIEKKIKVGSVLIVAGPGNNGADGIALARILQGRYDVKLFVPFKAKSDMAKKQLQRAKNVGVQEVDAIQPCDVVVDALFGAGLNKPLDAKCKAVIQTLNATDALKIACDIPTGIYEDTSVDDVTFHADITVTMGALKTSLFSDAASDFVGKIKVANLGVSRCMYEGQSNYYLLEKTDFDPPLRTKINSHKGLYGHVNVFAGQKQGAALLCASAATAFGAGLVSVITNETIAAPMCLMVDTHTSKNCTAIAIGMGLGNEYPDDFLKQEVVKKDIPVVLDADSFLHPLLLDILNQTDRKVVLTPHPKEFSQLLRYANIDATVAMIQSNRFYYAKSFCQKYPHVTLVLKGANTIIAKNDTLYLNPFASNKLSKGGSGDVLSGLVSALLAQGYEGLDAAIQSSLALSFAARKYKGANYGMDATDLIKSLKKL
jgi:hydroxyethylthiazole kinase-like uncharacterized protein yjeF